MAIAAIILQHILRAADKRTKREKHVRGRKWQLNQSKLVILRNSDSQMVIPVYPSLYLPLALPPIPFPSC